MKSIMLLATIVLATVFSGSIMPSFTAQPDDGRISRARSKDRGWLGVSIQDMTPRLARSMDSKTNEGALVTEVLNDTPADKAGLREEDIIVEFDGKTISDADDLTDAVRRTKPGASVNIAVVRTNQRTTMQAVLGSQPRPRTAAVIPPIAPHPPSISTTGVRGLQLRGLNDQLAEYFQIPDKRGVLVEEVEEESNAEKAGLKAGDVITKIGQDAVEDVRDVRRALNRYDDDDKVDIEIVRKGNQQKLTVVAEDLSPRNGYRYYFKGSPHSGWWDDNDFDEFEFEMEGLRPHLDKLKLELNGLKDDLRIDARELGHSLRKNLPKRLSGKKCGQLWDVDSVLTVTLPL
ncbi:MAG: PDZ domain-containing protein [Bacteroidota bacterium]